MDTDLFKRRLRILHLEDDENDHLLVVEVLGADGLDCDFVVVKSKREFSDALAQGKYDLIISDFSLPSYDGLSALAAARTTAAETPFVFFSGTIGEDVAVDSLRNGAVDYVLKQKPGRLTAAVRRAVRDAGKHARLKEAQRALRQSEERLRIVAKATNDVLWEWNLENDQVWFGENFQAAFGHAVEPTVASDRWFDFIHADDKSRVVSSLCSLLAAGGRVWWSEYRWRRSDGAYALIFDRASVVYDDSHKPLRLVGLKIDVSERKAAEEKIRQQAELLDQAHDAIVLCDLDQRVVYWNQSAERIYGWLASEAKGAKLDDLLFQGNPPPQAGEIARSLAQRGEWLGELNQSTRDGKKLVVQTRTMIIRDDEGVPKSLLTLNTDITEHKQLEEQFLRTQRLESLGVLVGGIAHDLNNTLAPIMIGVEILQTEPLSPEAAGILLTMDSSARRSAEMVRQMLVFARGGEASKTSVQPDRLLREMGKVISDTFPKSIHCRVNAAKELKPLYCVPTQVHQILMNLCVNARDAMPGGGTLTLAATNVTLSALDEVQFSGGKPGEYVCLSVTDTGTGIAPEQIGKLFQPFFTTKAPGKGTGLGLSTCQGIVKRHGGFITVKSRLKVGTEFRAYLPAAEPKHSETAAPVPCAPPGKGERILVVDDEESILAMTRAALENYGYVVTTAASGLEAIGYFREHPQGFQLIITDNALPFMGGQAIIAALRKMQPDIRVILTSGSDRQAEETLHTSKIEAFLPKPFTTEQLLRTAHDVLAK